MTGIIRSFKTSGKTTSAHRSSLSRSGCASGIRSPADSGSLNLNANCYGNVDENIWRNHMTTCAAQDGCGSAPKKFHYAWVIAAVTFLTLLVTAGIRSTPGILIVPLEHEFGWSRATISLAVSVNLLLYGLMGPFAAGFFSRFGVRRTMAVALLLLALGVSSTTLMTKPWHMVLIWGVVVGCGAGMTAYSLSATVVNRWFSKSQGTVMGVLTASAATGQLVFLPFLASLSHHHGWR